MLGQQIDVFLDAVERGVAGFGQPAAQTFQRPDVAEPGLRLQRAMRGADHRHHLGRKQRAAVLPLDHDVRRIGAGQLAVEPAGGFQRLLAVRHLIGEPVARLQGEMRRAEPDEQGEADQRESPRPVHDPVDNGANQPAEPIHGGIGGRACLRQARLVADEQRTQ